MDAGARAAKGPVNSVGAGDTADVMGKEAHAILMDVEVGDKSDILGKVTGTVRFEGEDGGVCIGETTLQLCESLLEAGEGVLQLAGLLEMGLSGDMGKLRDVTDVHVGGDFSVHCQLHKFFRHSDSIFCR